LLTVAWPLLRPGCLPSDSQRSNTISLYALRSNAFRFALAAVGWGLLGLTPWLYLAAQFILFRPFDYYRGQGLPYHYYWGNPAGWGDVVNLALGAGFRGKIFTYGWANLAELSLRFVATLRSEMGIVGLLLGAVGGIALLLGPNRRAGVFSGLIFVSAALFGINIAGDIPKAGVYYLPAYVIWSVWAGVGVGCLVAPLWRSRRAVAPWVAVAMLTSSSGCRSRRGTSGCP
jgi:hypothetical protein